MKAKMYHEIFREFDAAKKPEDRVAVLQRYGNLPFKEMLNFVFNPDIKIDISGIPPYKPSIIPEGLNDTYLHREIPKLYMFIPVHKKYRAKLQPKREAAILVSVLSSLHKEEAKILEKVLTKKLDVKFLTAKLVKTAFPDMPF